jgi:AcrR family transcriptional regulator
MVTKLAAQAGPRPGSLRQRKAAATRTRLMEAALDLFTRHGIEQLTIDQIAAAAETGKGTFYNYFSSKEEILVAFMVEQESRVAAMVPRFSEAQGPLESILRRFMREQFRLKRVHHAFTRIFMAELILRASQLADHIVRMQESVDPPLEQLFTRLQERRLIRPDRTIAEMVQSLKRIHFGVSCLWALEEAPFPESMRALDEQVAWFAGAIERRRS